MRLPSCGCGRPSHPAEAHSATSTQATRTCFPIIAPHPPAPRLTPARRSLHLTFAFCPLTRLPLIDLRAMCGVVLRHHQRDVAETHASDTLLRTASLPIRCAEGV